MRRFDFTAHLPAKRMGAGVLFLDDDENILIVKPTYREEWLLPGGIVEANESPADACAREVEEELGLRIKAGRLLCLEYRSASPPKTESLQFIFYGGVLTASQREHISLQEAELSVFQFVSLDEAEALLESRSARRVEWAWQALREETTIYAENGEPNFHGS
jgi:8-oxo-dGTP pyrophosphatase MutT (NUDIX family)